LKVIVFIAISVSVVLSQPKVSSIEFFGNDFFSKRELSELINTKINQPFNKLQFESDVRNILDNYFKNGYYNASVISTDFVTSEDSANVSIKINLSEGKKTEIGKIQIEGNKIASAAALRKIMLIKEGQTFDPSTLSTDISNLLDYYEARGFTFATITIQEILLYKENNSDKLSIKIKIDENERIKIDEVMIQGNTETKKEVVEREIPLSKDRRVSKEKMLEIKQKLENLGYFESVDVPKIYQRKNSTVLGIKVREGNTNTIDGIIGYVPPSQNEDKGFITGQVNLSFRNLFGTGRRLDARFQKEIRTTQDLELKYLEPWFLNFPVNITFGVNQRVQDSTYTRLSLSGGATITVFRNFSLTVALLYDRIIPSENVSMFDSRILSSAAEIKYDSRDYIYNPTKGILYKSGYSAGQKRIFNFLLFNVQNNFIIQKINADLDFYSSFFKRQTLLLGFHGAEVRSSKLELADYFRLGGLKTIRGYREEQFLCSRAAWSNVELRYSLSRRSFAAAFYDVGYYIKPEDEILISPKQEGLLFGYGIGIRVETSLGQFGVSYALGKGDSILEGKLHFGIINDF